MIGRWFDILCITLCLLPLHFLWFFDRTTNLGFPWEFSVTNISSILASFHHQSSSFHFSVYQGRPKIKHMRRIHNNSPYEKTKLTISYMKYMQFDQLEGQAPVPQIDKWAKIPAKLFHQSTWIHLRSSELPLPCAKHVSHVKTRKKSLLWRRTSGRCSYTYQNA
jgi:hypothetical protein